MLLCSDMQSTQSQHDTANRSFAYLQKQTDQENQIYPSHYWSKPIYEKSTRKQSHFCPFALFSADLPYWAPPDSAVNKKKKCIRIFFQAHSPRFNSSEGQADINSCPSICWDLCGSVNLAKWRSGRLNRGANLIPTISTGAKKGIQPDNSWSQSRQAI